MRRNRNIMLRLSEEEYQHLLALKPPGQELASFARAVVVEAASGGDAAETLRRAASFIVASLSPEITYEEALSLFDDHVLIPGGEVAHGRGD